jgi:glycyl-tRNA synthetase beta chain
LLGDFDPAFLEVPREVIQLTMRTNQKYFACVDASGKLAPNFICTANIVAEDGGVAIVNGNRKVLAARLSDANFFWEQDLKVPLAEQAKKLAGIVFHEKLGTVADKVDRVAKLARWLVERGVVKGGNPDHAEQAARLAKADLVTGMVGEFPELQGVMGGYYAHAEGLSHDVAEAIRDHYKPVGQSDDVPTAPITVAVSLADKLDSVAAFFLNEMMPTGSKDPFALRRSALAIIRLILANDLRMSLWQALVFATASVSGSRYANQLVGRVIRFQEAKDQLGDLIPNRSIDELTEPLLTDEALSESGQEDWEQRGLPAIDSMMEFFADRLTVQQREAGVRHDLIDAVFALGGEDDLVLLLARVKALQALVSTKDGTNLLAGYKRAANILRKEGWDEASGTVDSRLRGNDGLGGGEGSALPYQAEPAESALIAALDTAEATAETAVKDENFEGAMAALAALRGPIDAFFDSVTVNDVDPAKRTARLGLLARIRGAVHRVADFSKIEG